jgi:[acyl-carrier-protein] S-malonyltransferase
VPAFVFPGQGSQRPGMGRPWTAHPSWELVGDASEATGRDIAWLLLEAGQSELTETRNAQLATVTMSLLVLDAVERVGLEPTAVAGHSVGEYSALIASGALGFEDGLRLVAERGEAMQAAADADPGIMVLVSGIDSDAVDVACRLAEGDVWVANFNSATETVIAGEAAAVARAGDWARQLGARRLAPIAAGGAFHTPYMGSARGRLRKALSEVAFHPPEVPVVANVDARAHTGVVEWELLLSAQLCSPVRWHQSIALLGGRTEAVPGAPDQPLGRIGATSLAQAGGRAALDHRDEAGERLFVELGPGSSLSTMIRQSLRGAETFRVIGPDGIDRLVDAVLGGERSHAEAGHHGEHLYVSERLVISSAAGIFQPSPECPAVESPLEVGSLLGTVGTTEIRSPFAGELMGLLAHPGERVQVAQPIAWLRAADHPALTTQRRTFA